MNNIQILFLCIVLSACNTAPVKTESTVIVQNCAEQPDPKSIPQSDSQGFMGMMQGVANNITKDCK